jgi:DNA-directed RNA polymerase specialized sigma subunit
MEADTYIIERALDAAPFEYREQYMGQVWEKLQQLKETNGMIKALRNFVRHIHYSQLRQQSRVREVNATRAILTNGSSQTLEALIALCQDETDKNILMLSIVEKLTLREVAARLDIGRSTVSDRLKRLRGQYANHT